jgi:rhamnogalacturonyl hydrolase YesR
VKYFQLADNPEDRFVTNTSDILTEILAAAEEQDYSGYSKFDALNSPLLKFLTFNNKWLRFFFTQVVKESPFHIRPLLGVKPSRNPKGIALFARAYLFIYQKTGDPQHLKKAEDLIQWLIDNPSPGCTNLCWGYNFIWQSTRFLQDIYEPNVIVSLFVGEALMHAYRTTHNQKYLEAARSVADFLIKDLPVAHETEDERAITYVLRKVQGLVVNSQVLTGAFLAKLWKHTGEAQLLEFAKRHINFTVNRRTDYYCWYYTFPRSKSPKTHDNYHTGEIIDGMMEFFEETGDDRYLEVYWKALDFYQKNLFEKDGAPRWMSNKKYPFDIHGSAQGIITFKKAARHRAEFRPQTEIITDWVVKNLYRKETRDFAYRQSRWIKWNYSLMRWCNAWMARAFAEPENNDKR